MARWRNSEDVYCTLCTLVPIHLKLPQELVETIIYYFIYDTRTGMLFNMLLVVHYCRPPSSSYPHNDLFAVSPCDLSLTRRDGTFQTAWNDSFLDAYHCCEQGGYIYVGTHLFVKPCLPTFTALLRRLPSAQPINQSLYHPGSSGRDYESANEGTERVHRFEQSRHPEGQCYPG